MDNWDSRNIELIKDNTEKMADAFTRIADALEKLANKEEALSYGSMLTKDDFLELPPVDFVQLLEAYVKSARSKEANKEE